MRNVRLTLSYDGSEFVGWQIQPNGRSVQQVLEAAIHGLTGESVRVLAAGRTDSGVHALGQVANFRTASAIPPDQIRRGLQSFLPDDVVIRAAADVPPEFHATYSARSKRYRYVILNSPIAQPMLRRYVWRTHRPLDIVRMQAAAGDLLGTHDFRCFESQWPNKATSVRTVLEAHLGHCPVWPVWGDAAMMDAMTDPMADETPPGGSNDSAGPFLWFDIAADGFLYNMVRAIVGTLVEIGRGRWEPDRLRQIIAAGERSQAGATAPPQGLYLVRVDYE
jgi:tRNA pseudouridine38-40 synthase